MVLEPREPAGQLLREREALRGIFNRASGVATFGRATARRGEKKGGGRNLLLFESACLLLCCSSFIYLIFKEMAIRNLRIATFTTKGREYETLLCPHRTPQSESFLPSLDRSSSRLLYCLFSRSSCARAHLGRVVSCYTFGRAIRDGYRGTSNPSIWMP